MSPVVRRACVTTRVSRRAGRQGEALRGRGATPPRTQHALHSVLPPATHAPWAAPARTFAPPTFPPSRRDRRTRARTRHRPRPARLRASRPGRGGAGPGTPRPLWALPRRQLGKDGLGFEHRGAGSRAPEGVADCPPVRDNPLPGKGTSTLGGGSTVPLVSKGASVRAQRKGAGR